MNLDWETLAEEAFGKTQATIGILGGRGLGAGIKAAEDRLECRRIVGEVKNNLEFARPQE